MTDEHYEDCDRCGERYHGEFVEKYLRTVEIEGGADRVCLRCLEREGEVVHILLHGLPLCRFTTKPPVDWPKKHKWVRPSNKLDANCDDCLDGLETHEAHRASTLPAYNGLREE